MHCIFPVVGTGMMQAAQQDLDPDDDYIKWCGYQRNELLLQRIHTT